MEKIFSLKELDKLPKITAGDKSTVLVGGCFDLLHIGHLRFLKKAKNLGRHLIILLESDVKVKKLKGKNRPWHCQKERAEMLASLEIVDFIILLENIPQKEDYRKIVLAIHPKIIAVTQKDQNIVIKKEHARFVGADFKIIPLIKTFSTSNIARTIGIE